MDKAYRSTRVVDPIETEEQILVVTMATHLVNRTAVFAVSEIPWLAPT